MDAGVQIHFIKARPSGHFKPEYDGSAIHCAALFVGTSMVWVVMDFPEPKKHNLC